MSCIVYLYLPTSIQWTPSAGLNTAPRLGDQDQTVQTHGSREDIKKREIVREEDFDEHVRINPNPFSDPRNRTIRVVSIIAKPFLQFKESGYGRGRARLTGNDQFEGFCVDMLEEIGRLLGIRYEIHLVGDNSYGEKKSISPPETVQVMSLNPITGQPRIEHRTRRHQIWNGMIGEVVNGTADMAVAPVTINHARARVVDFSEPFLTFGISLIIKKPGKKKPGIFSFLHPLAYSVWLAILAACLVVSCGLWVIAKLSPLEWRYQTDPNTDRVRYHPVFTYFNSLWFSFAAFVQQGVDFAPRSPGARVLSSSWWFFTLIMIAYYTANLAAFLTVSRRVPPIKGWEDLLHSDIEYGSLNSGSTKGFFLHTRLEPFRSMGRRMVQNPHWFADSVQNGVDRVWRSKGKYAFVLESLMNEYYNNRDPCDTMMVGEPFGNNGYGIALPRKSPFKEEISLAIARLREAQVLFSLRKKWWIERGQCNDVDEQSSSEALALINVAGVFYILTVGLILALITSLVELRLHQHRLRRPQLPSDGSHALISHVHIHSPKKVICNKILPTQNIEHSLTSKGLEEKNHLNRESAEIHSSNPSQLRWNPKRSLCTPLNWTRRYLRGGGVAISKANDNRVTGNESDDPARFSTIRNSTITLATELNRSIVGETGNYDFQNHPASEAKLSTSCLIHSTGVINLLAQKQGLIINGEDI